MSPDQTTKAPCPKCHNDMIYVTALPHRTAHQMMRATFACYTCNQTRNYMLSAEMAESYAGGASVITAA